jgi:hypothetical protein
VRILTPWSAAAGAGTVLVLALAFGAGSGGASPAPALPPAGALLPAAGAPAAGMGPAEVAVPVRPTVVGGTATRTQYHEFRTECTITDHRKDDPIVFPGLAGASHDHTFFGNTTTTATSTVDSLGAGATSCLAPGDLTAYWMPTLYAGDTVVNPDHVIVYYKSGVEDYRTVRPFPVGFRMVVGDMHAAGPAEFTQGYWSCSSARRTPDVVQSCSRAKGQQVYARLQSPSCWDGLHLDSANHKSHVVYPARGRCPADHPVALPMLEFKVPYEVGGKAGTLRLSSGAGYTFHYDFVNRWDPATQAALVGQCINGGLQCDPHGFDQFHPEHRPVLDPRYRLAR